MKKSTSALFYSAFVCPGAGLFVLQQKKRAYLYLAVTGVFLAVIMVDAYRKAQIIADKIVHDMLSGGTVNTGALNQILMNLPATITQQMKTLPGIFPAGVMTGLSIGLVVLWGVGMLDTYWQGQKIVSAQK